jgi:hypothetical protein
MLPALLRCTLYHVGDIGTYVRYVRYFAQVGRGIQGLVTFVGVAGHGRPLSSACPQKFVQGAVLCAVQGRMLVGPGSQVLGSSACVSLRTKYLSNHRSALLRTVQNAESSSALTKIARVTCITLYSLVIMASSLGTTTPAKAAPYRHCSHSVIHHRLPHYGVHERAL